MVISFFMRACKGDRWFTASALAFSAVTLGHALQISNGHFHPRSVFWLTLAFAACATGILAPSIRKLESAGNSSVFLVLGVGLGVHFAQLLTTPPGIYLQPTSLIQYRLFQLGLVVAAVLAMLGMQRRSRFRHLRIVLLLVTHFLLGVWIIKMSPNPIIDVYVFHSAASEALLDGVNPYAIRFPNIYGDAAFYGKNLAEDDWLNFGFPYPPLSLFLALPGHVLLGDFRFSQLAAMTLSGALMAYTRPGRLAPLAASLFLFTPRGFFVLEQGWSEPFVVLLLSAAVFCAVRSPRLLASALGLMYVTKQYMVLAFPTLLLLLPRPVTRLQAQRMIVHMGLVAAVTVPLILWDISAFWESAVMLHIRQPFRLDALTYLAWLAQTMGVEAPQWLAFAAAVPALALVLWKCPSTPSGFAAATALVYFVFFSLGKQAFCNYYFFLVGTLCCSVAATLPSPNVNADQPSEKR